MLGEHLLERSDNLSRTVPTVEAKKVAEMSVKVLDKTRQCDAFDVFWELCQSTKNNELGVSDLVLQLIST